MKYTFKYIFFYTLIEGKESYSCSTRVLFLLLSYLFVREENLILILLNVTFIWSKKKKKKVVSSDERWWWWRWCDGYVVVVVKLNKILFFCLYSSSSDSSKWYIIERVDKLSLRFFHCNWNWSSQNSFHFRY